MAATGRRERKKQRTREAIVGAAFELFAERGFDGVTASEIAARADVARATLFSHFPTKEAIVLDQVGDDDPATIVRERAAGEAPLAALREHYRAFARATAENRVSAETAAMLRTRLNDDLKTAMREKNALAVSTIRLILAKMKEKDIESRGAGKAAEIGAAFGRIVDAVDVACRIGRVNQAVILADQTARIAGVGLRGDGVRSPRMGIGDGSC